jgi:hypothetical protein
MIRIDKNPNKRGKYKNCKIGTYYPINKTKFIG